MYKHLLFILCLCFQTSIFCQLTIQVNSIPANTPAEDDIFIAGNFNGWNSGSNDYILTENNGIYTITINPSPGLVEFKFTRGSWESVEGNENGGFQPNHTYDYTGGAQTASTNILGWEDLGGSSSNTTAAANVQIMDDDFYMPQLDRNRRIWLYLPPDYATSNKHYPVLYMQDAQNLFDLYTSFSGEWEIDETLNDLFEAGDYGCIVVGIENGGVHRLNEYSPWNNPDYGGGEGEAYAAFMVNTLKPYIDSHYRTLSGREFTGVAGSSMGGIISMYAAVEYQEVFGKVGIFSPAFWFSDSCYLHVQTTAMEEDLRTYFVAGDNESNSMVPDMMEMYNNLVEEGYDNDEMYFISHSDGQHSEWFWAREFPDVYDWLFGDLIISVPIADKPDLYLYPNPGDSILHIATDQQGYILSFYSTMGKKVLESKVGRDGNVDISGLSTGIYYLAVRDARQNTLHIDKFIKN